MASIPNNVSCGSKLVALDESEKQNYELLAKAWSGSGSYFNVTFHIEHRITGVTTPKSQSYPPLHSCSRSFFLPSSRLLRNAGIFIPLLFPHPIIPRELMADIVSKLIAYAKTLLSSSGALHFQTGNFRFYKMVFNIVVRKPYDDILDRVLEELARSKTPTESIKIVNLGRDAAEEWCRNCFARFTEGMQVVMLPCKHKYHHECINEWLNLKTRYACRLCNHPFSVPTTTGDQQGASDAV